MVPKTSSVREIGGSRDQALVIPTVRANKRIQGEGEYGHHKRIRQSG